MGDDDAALDNISDEDCVKDLLANPVTQVFTLQGCDVSAQRENLPFGIYILRLGNLKKKIIIYK